MKKLKDFINEDMENKKRYARKIIGNSLDHLIQLINDENSKLEKELLKLTKNE